MRNPNGGVGAREEAPSSAVTRVGNHAWVREQQVTEGAFVLVWGQERQVRLERKKGRNRKLQKLGGGGYGESTTSKQSCCHLKLICAANGRKESRRRILKG